jgi:hypothetical protein
VGEADPTRFPFSFNRSLDFEGRPERLTRDAGALLLRETDERFGLTRRLAARLVDPRHPLFITHPLTELLRARIYSMAQGHRDQDDLDDLRHDPALRLAVSERSGDAPLREPSADGWLAPDGLASQPTQSRLVEMLTLPGNRAALDDALFTAAAEDFRRLRGGRRARRGVLDVDSTATEVHGNQPGSAYNGHYRVTCYHPLVAILPDTGAWLAVRLREGNVHTSVGLEEFLFPLLERCEREIYQVSSVRGDAGMPSPELFEGLEARDIGYCLRLGSNDVLERLAEPHLRRPVGRPPSEPRTWCHELLYQAETWAHPRRVVLVVIEEPGELFLRHFFLVTNWTEDEIPGEGLLVFYRERAVVEGHIGDFKSVLRPALPSTSRRKSHVRGQRPRKARAKDRDGFACNEVNLLLYALAYNLANVVRRVTARATRQPWRLRRCRDTLLQVAGKVVLHARRVTVVIRDEVAPLWSVFLKTLHRLLPTGPPLPA